jgi:hypothetical protein
MSSGGADPPPQKADESDSGKHRAGRERVRRRSGAAKLTGRLDDQDEEQRRGYGERDRAQAQKVHAEVVATSPPGIDRPARHLARQQKPDGDKGAPLIRRGRPIEQRGHVNGGQSAYRPLHHFEPAERDAGGEKADAGDSRDHEYDRGRRRGDSDVDSNGARERHRDRARYEIRRFRPYLRNCSTSSIAAMSGCSCDQTATGTPARQYSYRIASRFKSQSR